MIDPPLHRPAVSRLAGPSRGTVAARKEEIRDGIIAEAERRADERRRAAEAERERRNRPAQTFAELLGGALDEIAEVKQFDAADRGDNPKEIDQ